VSLDCSTPASGTVLARGMSNLCRDLPGTEYVEPGDLGHADLRLINPAHLDANALTFLGKRFRLSDSFLALTRDTISTCFGPSRKAFKHFVDAVTRVPEVTEIVLFQDAEGVHIWTVMNKREWDEETAILQAQEALRSEYSGDELDLLILACPREDAEERLPTGFVRLYRR